MNYVELLAAADRFQEKIKRYEVLIDMMSYANSEVLLQHCRDNLVMERKGMRLREDVETAVQVALAKMDY